MAIISNPTPEQKIGIVEQLTGGLSAVFSDAGLLLTDRAGFIAGAGSDSPIAQAVRAISRRSCRVWARSENPPGSARQQAYYRDVCGPYLASLGEEPIPGSVVPAISGGQCPGVLYDVQIFATRNTDGAQVVINRPGEPGPIALAPTGAPIDCPEGSIRNEQYHFLSGGVIRFSFNGASCGPFKSVPRVVAVRTDGQPDTCGNGQPIIETPRGRPGLPPLGGPITVTLPGFGDVRVDVQVGPDGPIILFPDLALEVPVEVAPTINIGGGGGGGGGERTDPGAPGQPEDTGPGGESEGEAGEGEELVGLLVEVVSAPPGANRLQNNSVQPFRGIGYVRMGYPGRLAVDLSAGTVITPQFFLAPRAGLTAWVVQANIGFDLRITPYYREIDP